MPELERAMRKQGLVGVSAFVRLRALLDTIIAIMLTHTSVQDQDSELSAHIRFRNYLTRMTPNNSDDTSARVATARQMLHPDDRGLPQAIIDSNEAMALLCAKNPDFRSVANQAAHAHLLTLDDNGVLDQFVNNLPLPSVEREGLAVLVKHARAIRLLLTPASKLLPVSHQEV